MLSRIIGLSVLVLLLALNAGLIGHYYPILPARVGLYEYDESGPSAEPTVWMAKGWFAALLVAVFVLIPLVLMAVEWILSKLFKRSIRIPNRDYWLAPERKSKTEARRFSFMFWLANATELLMTGILLIVLRTVLGHPEVLRWAPYVVVGGYLIFVASSSFRHYLTFKKLPAQ
jgi:hypothetical protein